MQFTYRTPYSAIGIPILDRHELAAGKFAALVARHASRDLFDAHQMLATQTFEPEKLRLGFVLYGAMNRKDWRTVSVTDVAFDERELQEQLIPLLSDSAIQSLGAGVQWAVRIVDECRTSLAIVLPLRPPELEFLERINQHGEIRPDLLTSDPAMTGKILQHPQLLWKALNVNQHKKT